MNRIKLLVIISIILIGASVPVYGKEPVIKERGNITVFEDEICNMKEDYLYLEREIQELLEECD